MKKRLSILIALIILCIASFAAADTAGTKLTVLFTSDMHSYYQVHEGEVEGEIREFGGAGRLKAVLDAYSNDHSIVVDAGDFSQGTLISAAYTSDAYELRLMAKAGVQITTFGNHEFDYAGSGAAQMLQAAKASGDPLPCLLVPANLNLSGELTEEQKDLEDALAAYGAARYVLTEAGGVRIAVFGLLGPEAISCAPTSGVTWNDYIASAKETVKAIGDQADVIICVSHSGTNSDSATGEDIELAKQVPEIDVIISGHSHTTYHEPVLQGSCVIGSCGYYLAYVGRIELTVDANGKVKCDEYELIPVDETVNADLQAEAMVEIALAGIADSYLDGTDPDQIIAYNTISFENIDADPSLPDEIRISSLIADSYMYACRQYGLEADLAVVCAGTVRSTLYPGEITVSDAFEVCSLGVGADGSAGHPLVRTWLYGKDLRFMVNLEEVGKSILNGINMSFSGLKVTYDRNRLPLDKVIGLQIERADGTLEDVEDDKLYCVVLNRYALNMVSSLKAKTFGLVNLTLYGEQGYPDAQGSPVTDNEGREVKEWAAFRDYLASFADEDGVSTIPEEYAGSLGRKTYTAGSFFEILRNPNAVTMTAIGIVLFILLSIIVIIATHKRRKARRARRRAARAAKKAAA